MRQDSSALLQVENLAASYGKRQIVSGIGFSLSAGELCALIGLNGSGKTTLLKTVAGLLKADTGRVRVAGRDTLELDERRRARLMSYIPQRPSPIWGMTALEVALMGANPYLGLFDSPKASQRQAAGQALARLGMAKDAGKDFGQLSEGQKQLVILARTLVQTAPIMLMDEPDSALDFYNRHLVLEKIREVAKTEVRAGLITLHDPNLAMAYCDRLLLLRQGRILRELRTEELTPRAAEEAFSLLYGRVRILEYEKGLLMVRA